MGVVSRHALGNLVERKHPLFGTGHACRYCSTVEGSKVKRRIVVPREVLLVEIERRCADQQCYARNRIGLTKEEARRYEGFECERCERWNRDALAERDIPEWWEELMVTGLETIRPQAADEDREPSEVVTRLSDAYRSGGRARRQDDSSEAGGDSL